MLQKMNNIRMNKFQEDAKHLSSSLNVSGRFSFQKSAMKHVVVDIANKLSLRAEDSLLDIGCNCGDITIPLSFMCDSCTGVDGESAIERLKKRTQDLDNVSFIVGDFSELKIEEQYDCILIYSVLMYIDGYDNKRNFIKKACDLLKPGGRMLVGDVVNTSVKERYSNSEVGRKIDKEYKHQLTNLTQEDIIKSENNVTEPFDIMDDKKVCDLLLEIRNWGYESFLLPQSVELPFGYTRQDILIKRW